jgi:hypothetical protein
VGLRAGLDRCGNLVPTGIRSPDRPARRQSLYRLRYRAHRLHIILFQYEFHSNFEIRIVFSWNLIYKSASDKLSEL